ncbi:sensor histidine kinase [Nocardioides sp. R-C-SC26]|uniref:sensor histidine kinase n=1 Tax=Nocardioides sp. R-C-SC26 TaxID=2870414 RepID=UPI001E641C99|nr:sensor histidine kinase [Nocardioides sp. R-C-SC26]
MARQAADREARAEARSINEVLAESVVAPAVRADFVDGNTGALDRFDRAVKYRLEVGSVTHVNIWGRGGKLIYTTASGEARERLRLGVKLPLTGAQQRVLRDGGTGEVVLGDDVPFAKNPTGAASGTVQIFTKLIARNGTPLLFEAFYSLDDLEQRRQQIYQPFRWITLSALALLLILVTPIIWVLTRDVRRAGDERERLLQTGLDASDAERRRIARDLHDGVVQDLAGTSFHLAGLARDDSVAPQVRAQMTAANDSLRDSLKGLRALLAEIHPPEIQADGLGAALGDLIAPAAAVGVSASVSVIGADGASDEIASLVLRVAQEAVRNALRHAQASTLAVTVRSDGRILTLEVVDDGVGFTPTAPRSAEHYGLKGMSSLVRDRGGELTVTSAPGEGTEVRLEVEQDD